MATDWEQYAVNSNENDNTNQSNIDWEQYASDKKNNKNILLKDILQKISPTTSPGINVATGLMSAFVPGKQKEIVANLPQVMRGTKPTMAESFEQGVGRDLPALLMGGSSLLKQIATQAPWSAFQYVPGNENLFGILPEGRTGAAIEGALLGALPGAAKIPKYLPKTYKNIVKNVLKERGNQSSLYSKKYNDLFKEAEESGYGKFEHLIPEKLNISNLESYTPDNKLEALKEFSKSNNLENAQEAISELGHIIRPLKKKSSLFPYQKKQLKYAEEAKKHIEENMFKNKEGNINKELSEKHKDIQKGYATEKRPYDIDSIKKYLAKEISEKELVNKLSKGKFNVQRGKFHPEIRSRKLLDNIMKSKFGQGGLLGAGGAVGYKIINKLLGNEK